MNRLGICPLNAALIGKQLGAHIASINYDGVAHFPKVGIAHSKNGFNALNTQ